MASGQPTTNADQFTTHAGQLITLADMLTTENALQVPMAMHVQSVRLLSLLYIDSQATNQRSYAVGPTPKFGSRNTKPQSAQPKPPNSNPETRTTKNEIRNLKPETRTPLLETHNP